MNEIEKDYVQLKGMASGAAPYMRLAFAVILFVFIGIPCFVWGLGVLLYVWPLTLAFILFAIIMALQTPKGYRHGQRKKVP